MAHGLAFVIMTDRMKTYMKLVLDSSEGIDDLLIQILGMRRLPESSERVRQREKWVHHLRKQRRLAGDALESWSDNRCTHIEIRIVERKLLAVGPGRLVGLDVLLRSPKLCDQLREKALRSL